MDTKELAEEWSGIVIHGSSTTQHRVIKQLALDYLSQQKELEAKDIYITQTEVNCETLYDDLREERDTAKKNNVLLREALSVQATGFKDGVDFRKRPIGLRELARQTLSSTPTDTTSKGLLINIYNEANKLMVELGATGWNPDMADGLMNALSLYDNDKTTDMICLSKEELLSTSIEMMNQGASVLLSEDGTLVQRADACYKAMITQLLKDKQ